MSSQVATCESHAHFRTHQYLVREDEQPAAIYHINEGWACRYRLLPDGRRQITALYLPGDYCDPLWALNGKSSQPVVALTSVRATCLPCVAPSPTSGVGQQAFWRNLSDIIERQSNWLVMLGRKTASEKVAHVLVELFERLRLSGLTYGQQCAMPLTQIDIADLTGLTPVHVNRTLQRMRTKGLVELQAKWLRIPDLRALRQAAALQTRGSDGRPHRSDSRSPSLVCLH